MKKNGNIKRVEIFFMKVKGDLRKFLSLFIFVISCFSAFFFSQKCSFPVRLDQHAVTIASTIIGVVSTMFGLTATSYAFIWSEIRNESGKDARLEKILENYKKNLWRKFCDSLILTIILVIFNLLILGAMQTITSSILYVGKGDRIDSEFVTINYYYNNVYEMISWIIAIDIFLSIIDTVFMAMLNFSITNRDRQYKKIANRILKSISKRYDLTVHRNVVNKRHQNNVNYLEMEYNKIHYLEILLERILQNHESEGNAYSHIGKNTRLLEQIVYSKLQNEDFLPIKTKNIPKNNSMIQQCRTLAKRELNSIKEYTVDKANFDIRAISSSQIKPVEGNFVQVYNDLLLYRNAKLICTNSMIDGTMLRCTIKKRLLIFYMNREKFDGMDLSNISLSGADLSYANFSNCNLKGIKLRGTNCIGTDFTNSRMPGMHFIDTNMDRNSIHPGDIELTYYDDQKNTWDPHDSRQATCLNEATFANADVSRMTLIADGMVDESSRFPFETINKIPVIKDVDPFQMHSINLDNSKLYFSAFNNIDFANSSAFRAQMFNNDMCLVNATNVNFENCVLTGSCMRFSSFKNSNLHSAVLSDCYIAFCDFSGANLINSVFSNSNIWNCNFEDVSCINASFKNVIQKNNEHQTNNYAKKVHMQKIGKISFMYSTITAGDFSCSDISNIDFSYSILKECIFTKAYGSNSKFISSMISSSIWNSVKLKKAFFDSAVMRDSVFLSAKFENCNFKNSDFSNSIIKATFVGGIMENTKFCNVKELKPSCFRNIKLRRVDFTGSGITKKDFRNHSVVLEKCIFD